MNTSGALARWRVAVSATALLGAWPCLSLAAPVDVSYAFSGGAAFLSATGPVTAEVRGTVFGVPVRQVRTGVASGATSWNLTAGQLVFSFDGGASPSLDSVSGSLVLERRAGTILIDFPLLQIAALDPISIDLTLASTNDDMTNPVIGASAMDAAGVTSLIVFETPGALAARVERLPPAALPVPLATVASVAASNTNSGSRAALALVEAVFNGGERGSTLLTFDEDCVQEVLGACVASLAVTYDFSGMTSSMTARDASGTSPVSIPTPRPVPLPPTLWLLAAAVGGLAWGRGRVGQQARQ